MLKFTFATSDLGIPYNIFRCFSWRRRVFFLRHKSIFAVASAHTRAIWRIESLWTNDLQIWFLFDDMLGRHAQIIVHIIMGLLRVIRRITALARRGYPLLDSMRLMKSVFSIVDSVWNTIIYIYLAQGSRLHANWLIWSLLFGRMIRRLRTTNLLFCRLTFFSTLLLLL